MASRWEETTIAETPGQRLRYNGGWWAFLLALTMLLSMGGALNAAGWSEALDLVQLAIVASALLSLLLVLTCWNSLFSVAYGFVASIVVIVTLLHRSFFPDLALHDAILSIIQRNVAWFTALFSRAPAADNLIFVIQLCLLGWWISFFAVWSLFRHRQVLPAVIPAGIGLLVTIYYSQLNLTGYLVVYLVSVVLLAIFIELAHNQERWQIFQIRYAPDIFWDFLKAGLVFAAVVTALAWLAPSDVGRTTMERILRPFDTNWHRVEETWSRMYKSLRYQGPAVRTTKFGKSMGLGGPVDLTNRPIFEASIGQRSYWRGAVFDFYTGRSWQNTDADLIIIEHDQNLGEPAISAYTEITATIHPLDTTEDVIFGAPQPLRVSVPTNADASRVTKEGDLNISLLRSRVPFSSDSIYQVVSTLTNAPVDALQHAGTTYPQWVRDRYLQLPEEFPDRVRQLAQSTTANLSNPYDKASAIEAFLRQYQYDQNIDAPPEGVDGVDYFLFGIKKGYCDYYASAMVTMLRAVGIPARIAVGYSPGDYIQQEDIMPSLIQLYRVLERNAHAWPEVYFPSYGWIQFEPTASEPSLSRPMVQPAKPAGTVTPTAGGGNNGDEDLRPDRFGQGAGGSLQADPAAIRWLKNNWPTLTAVTAIMALLVGGFTMLRWRRQAFFRNPELLARLFDVLGSWAARLRVPWLISQTPLERAAAFNAAVPEAEPAVGRLAGLFVAQRYGQVQPSSEAVGMLIGDWDHLEPTLWKRWLSRLAKTQRVRWMIRRKKVA